MALLKKEEKDFLIKFLIYFFPPYIIFHFVRESGALIKFTIEAEKFLLSISGTKVLSKGSLLFINNNALKIVFECTGITSILLFLSIIFADSHCEKRRAKAIVIFVPSLILINLLRLFFIFLIGVKLRLDIEMLHMLTWFLDMGIVILMWMWTADIRLHRQTKNK